MNMKIRITKANGILKVHIRELVRAAREREDMGSPPLWMPSSQEDEDDLIWDVPLPHNHDPAGRNRRPL